MSETKHTPPDGWEWVRAKLEKCCPELTRKARTESIRGTPWEVMGWMHILCSYAQAANRTYVHIAVEQEKRAVEAEALNAEMLAALKRAEQFISNGVEFGYVTMPDADTPDPAHETLPLIRCAIARAETGEGVVPCKGCGHPVADEPLDEPLCDACTGKE